MFLNVTKNDLTVKMHLRVDLSIMTEKQFFFFFCERITLTQLRVVVYDGDDDETLFEWLALFSLNNILNDTNILRIYIIFINNLFFCGFTKNSYHSWQQQREKINSILFCFFFLIKNFLYFFSNSINYFIYVLWVFKFN